METKGKKLLLIMIFALIIVVGFFGITKYKKTNYINSNANIELLKAKTYEQFEEGTENIEGTDNVKFTATFLRDIDGDGKAEKIKGTCKPVTGKDILLFEVIVSSSGYLENGKIEIDGKNFSVSFNEIKDQFLSKDYVGSYNQIELKQMLAGTQKVIIGNIKSELDDNINNFSRDDNKIIFTGVFVDEDGNKINLRKEVNLTVDWYGDIQTKIPDRTNNYTNLESIKSSETDNAEINLIFDVKETKNQLLLKENHVEIEIPELNGYKALDVTSNNSNDLDINYNSENGLVTIDKVTEANDDGVVKRIYDYIRLNEKYTSYNLKVIYPPEAFNPEEEDVISLYFPIKAYYVGYNNSSEEFDAIKTSNTDQNVILVSYHKPIPRDFALGLNIGNYFKNGNNYISKIKPYRIYNYISISEADDDYKVLWSYFTGDNPPSNHVVLKENREVLDIDEITNSDGSKQSMNDFIKNKGIYFSFNSDGFDENGEIVVFDDDTDEILLTVTRRNVSTYTSTNPYLYKKDVKHVRVELNNLKKSTSITIGHIKNIDDDYVTNNFTEEQFDNFRYINTTVAAYIDNNKVLNISGSATYEAPYSSASISVSPNNLRTQETLENATITLTMDKMEERSLIGWKDGIFLVKIPNDIAETNINRISCTNSNVEILNYEYFENIQGKFIKIITKNKTDEAVPNSIQINCNFTADMRALEGYRYFELYAINGSIERYSSGKYDAYDVDDDENLVEIVNYSTTSMMFSTPSGLLTYEMISDYDDEGNVMLSPQRADIIRKAEVSNENNTAKVTVCLDNKYTSISDVKILGKVPFTNNTELFTDVNLNSEFTAHMLEGGFEIPVELQYKGVKVYYSENENPTKDLSNLENGWMKLDEVNNWDNIKTYLIDFGSGNMETGNSYSLSYNLVIPEGVQYNKASYSHHGVYFNINTINGKYASQTAPFKLGLMIARKYDLELTKYQIGKNKTVPGATYVVTDQSGLTGSGNSSKATNENGKALFKNLYVNRKYRLYEIDSPIDYELNDSEVKFEVVENGDGTLKLNILSGTTKSVSINKDSETNEYTANIEVEDKEKARLKIIKENKDSGDRIPKIYFNVLGENFNKVYGTNQYGEVLFKGLSLNKEYMIEEIYGEGYYLISPIKFRINKQGNDYDFEILEGNVAEESLTIDDEIPVLNLNIENELIPRYKLIVEKIEKNNISKKISEAEYSLKSIDNSTTVIVKTDEQGLFEIDNLYQYVEGKEITGKYELNETEAPAGYVLNDELIRFTVGKNNDEELEVNIENRDSLKTLYDVEIEGNVVKLILQNRPVFKLKKVDADTMEPIAGVKFVIKENNEAEDYAKDTLGNYVGTLNEDGEYVLITDEEGIIQAPLKTGKYKAIEIEEKEGYENLGIPTYFELTDDSNNEVFSIGDREITDTVEINYIEDLLDLSESIKNGNHFETTKFNLLRDLDFNDDSSYRNPEAPYEDDTISVKERCLEGFEPIGGGANNVSIYFSGIFDGQEHELKNLHLATATNTALFGLVKNTIIMNLGISGENIIGNDRTAGFAVYIGDVTVYNCYNKCNITGNDRYNNIGGILCDYSNSSYKGNIKLINCHNEGNISNGVVGGIISIGYSVGDEIILKNCYNEGEITGRGFTGGLMGTEIYQSNTNVIFENCYNTGKITGSGDIGGLAGGPKFATVTAENCYNTGNIYNTGSYTGGLFGYNYSKISLKNCYNTGNIDAPNCPCVGGLLGYNNGSRLIENCYNTGNVVGSNDVGGLGGDIYGEYGQDSYIKNSYNIGNITGQSQVGGLIGVIHSESINGCFNSGTITGNSSVGGIVGNAYNTGFIVNNTYNEGHIIGNTSSSIGGIVGSGKVSNSYNVGKITVLDTITSSSTVGIISGTSNPNTNTNCYYLNTIPTARVPKIYETVVSEEEITSKEFFDRLNVDGVWEQRKGRAPTIKGIGTEIKDATEIEIKNSKLQFEITTEVKSINGNKGGTISGENEIPYELVEYGKNNTKEIKIIPEENYIISNITINGKNIEFTPEADGTFTIPGFEGIKEDKHIIVSFVSTDTPKFDVQKIDKNTNEKLENAELYISKNVIQGINSSQANSGIQLSGLENGRYKVIINAEISSEETNDFGWAAITTGGYNTSTNVENKFINISGKIDAKDYESDEFEVTTPAPYFVNIGYYKNYNNENDKGKDAFIINNIRLLNIDTDEEIDITDSLVQLNSYCFVKYKNAYVPTNSKTYVKENYVSATSSYKYTLLSFITPGQYHVEIDAKIKNSGVSKGWATITSGNYIGSIDYPYANKIMVISGNIDKTTYKSNPFIYDGSTNIYLNVGYIEDAETKLPDDIFEIYDIRIVPEDNNIGFTNSEGKLRFYVPYGEYLLYEKTAPEGYQILNEPLAINFEENGEDLFTLENEKMPKVIAHHYLKDENGNYTETKVAEDEEYVGNIGETYKVNPHMDIEDYTLEKDENNEYVIPENASGIFENGVIEVTYYYERTKIPLIIHHYILGTEDKVLLVDGTEAEDELDSGLQGTTYETQPISEEELNEKYELVSVTNNSTGTYEYSEVEVTYYYRVKKFNVTTAVKEYEVEDILGNKTQIKGGIISGEADETYEIVEYGENSEKEIKAIPDTGFLVKEVTVNDEPIEFTPEEDGSVVLNKFINMKSNKNVVVTFSPAEGSIKINHFIEGTENRIIDLDGNIVEEETRSGPIGTAYATKEREDLLDKYELVSTPEITSGNYLEEVRVFNYYYKLKHYNYKIEYYFDDVKDEDLTEENEAEFKEVITEYEDKIKEGYRLKEEVLPIEISTNEEENIMKVYYVTDDSQTKEISYKVEYYKENELQIPDTIIKTKTIQVLEENTIEVDKNEINTTDKYEHYNFKKIMLNDEEIQEVPDTVNDKDVIKIYYEKKESTIVVKYVDRDGEEIKDKVELSGKVTDKYDISTIEDSIPGYKLREKSEDGLVEFTEEPKIIIFTYDKEAKVIINYIEKETNEVLEIENKKGIVGEEYETHEKTYKGYELIEEEKPTNNKGTMTKEDIEVNYYYKKIKEQPKPEDKPKENEEKTPEKVTDKSAETNTNKVEQIIPATTVQSIESNSKEVTPSTVISVNSNGTNNTTNTKTSETKNVKSGDNLPVVVISIILVILTINTLLEIKRRSGKRVRRNSREKGRRVK